MKDSKLKYFEYFLSILLDKSDKKESNDFSILKVQKLLFLTVAIDSGKDKDNVLINEIFDNFVAMPYGHVESDIYSAIRHKQFEFFTITSSKTELNRDKKFDVNTLGLDAAKRNSIDLAIEKLLNENESLLKESPFNLVELSHQYKSWRKYFREANLMGINSLPIPSVEIIEEEKYFHLNQLELF
jgi:uncharacterized phage-associated protein